MSFKKNNFFSFKIKKWRELDWFYVQVKKQLLIIIGITEAKHDVLVIKQYRPPFDDYVISFPMGAFEIKKDRSEMTDIAKKEAEEETGFEIKRIFPIIDFARSCGLTDEIATTYLAYYGEEQGKQYLHENEDIEVIRIPINSFRKEILSMIKDGFIIDSSILIMMNLSLKDFS